VLPPVIQIFSKHGIIGDIIGDLVSVLTQFAKKEPQPPNADRIYDEFRIRLFRAFDDHGDVGLNTLLTPDSFINCNL